MYERLSAVFQKLGVDYEIIFVNDGSPDEQGLSSRPWQPVIVASSSSTTAGTSDRKRVHEWDERRHRRRRHPARRRPAGPA